MDEYKARAEELRVQRTARAADNAPATAREALSAWLDYLVHERRASPRTVRAYGDAVAAYLGFLEPHRGETLTLAVLSDISAGDVRASRVIVLNRTPSTSRRASAQRSWWVRLGSEK